MTETESFHNITAPIELGARDGLVSALVQSHDLGNSAHYDIQDASIGIAIWTEVLPNHCKSWNMIFPNIQIDHNNKTYQGLVIQLHHGIAISWDGRYVRHCSSIPLFSSPSSSSCNHVFGTFWAANSPNILGRMQNNTPVQDPVPSPIP
jgi:hypothetical protein